MLEMNKKGMNLINIVMSSESKVSDNNKKNPSLFNPTILSINVT